MREMTEQNSTGTNTDKIYKKLFGYERNLVSAIDKDLEAIVSVALQIQSEYYIDVKSIRQKLKKGDSIGNLGVSIRRYPNGGCYISWVKFKQTKVPDGMPKHMDIIKKGGGTQFRQSKDTIISFALPWELDLFEQYEEQFAVLREYQHSIRHYAKFVNRLIPDEQQEDSFETPFHGEI